MNPKTKSLFHFTKSLDTILLILKNGFWPRYSLEDITWVTGRPHFFAFPMVCFCDIPISRLHRHTDFYGSYGIGLSREWGIKSHLNPVFYLSSGSFVCESLLGMMRNPHPKVAEAKAFILKTLAYCKPLKGKMKASTGMVEKDFYPECEWRFVPEIHGDSKYVFLPSDKFRDSSILKAANDERKAKDMLSFQPSDVRYLLVNSIRDIPMLVDFIQTKLGHLAHDDTKLLLTRIVALEEIEADI